MTTYSNIRKNIPYKAFVERTNSINFVVRCFENNKLVSSMVVDSESSAKYIAEDFVGPSEKRLLVE